ncbi:TonB-dependent receptor family protein [Pseudohongiella sp.]|uniref:TonB-dependent receptor plug domain-containing protein n=1 Tax=marine sediment metagenome TaxID=412755 RepID=A0A0F9W0P9_9ZZZZ|nr:TonB-dependent receptor [Pseudohongiella sp.]HDZ08343.1 TonB-dependent receptor [Pseudohongiella sp.]HEA61936.1 TonB-dependent receptor [Pseudohongiella sp.]
MSALPSYTKSRLAVALALTALPLTVSAQTGQAEDTFRSASPGIEVIRVTGNQQGHAYLETGTVTLIDLEQIQAIQPLSTEDVLRRIPGVNIKGEEETSIVANFGLRGLSASESKSLMLEDGVPVAPGLFIGNDRYFNTRIQRVEQVEILKGSSSLRYGPSTIGGVVNYITKTPDDGVKVSGRAGSFNLREMNIEAGGTNVSGDAYAGVVATYADSDGFMDKDYEMADVMLKAGTAIGNNQRVGVKVSFHENDANISYRGVFLDAYRSGADYNPAPDDWYLQERQAVDLNHEWIINDATTLKTLFYWSDVSRDYWRYSVDTPASNLAGRWVYTDALTGNNRSFERLGAETRLSLAHEWGGLTADTEFGFRVMTEESDDNRIRATRQQDRTGTNDRHRIDSADSVAAYVQSRIEVTERLAVTPGLRIEDYEQKQLILTQNNASAATSNTEFLPGVGATFDVTSAAQIYGGVYRAFSPASNGVALDGLTDQNLDGERSTNYEIGIRGAEGALSYEVAAFAMDFSNQVVTGNSDPNLSQSNAGETEHYGMEFVLDYDFGAGFSVNSNATWIPTSEFRTGTFEGNRLPYAPKILANIGLNYTVDRLQTALTAHHRGEQYGDPSNQVDLPTGAAGGIWGGLLPAYTVFDLTAQYNIDQSFTVFGAVKNITDKKYIAGLRQGIYVGPERSLEVGFRYGF